MTVASRKSLLERLKEREAQPTAGVPEKDIDFWNDIYRRIRQDQLVPILGSTIRLNRIFDIDWDTNLGVSSDENTPPDNLPVDEELSQAWAEDLKYPLPDKNVLARVAQYNRVVSADPDQAKNNYLLFLKKTLLLLAEADDTVGDEVPGLRRQVIDLSFSDIASALDYPRYPSNRVDPLRLLARLRLPIYVTTSYYDFLERALRLEGADKVRTQFCLWNMDEARVLPEHRPDPAFKPSREEPVVYHLFGYERYPSSLVLSEDDYLDFLLAFVQDVNSARPLIPHYLRSALEESSLLLMGYRLQDWDFRVLFRWLINCLHRRLSVLERMYGVAIHLDPKYQTTVTDVAGAKQYLKDYFGSANFRVELGSIDVFIDTLWHEWNRRRKGE